MSREMKDSGLEWVAEIPATWMTGRLKNYFSFGKGLPITKDNLVEAGIPVISYGQIHSKQNTGTGLNDALFRYVNEDFLSTNPNSLVNKGDFIFADTSEDHDGCGNCVYVNSDQTLFAGYHTIILSGYETTDNRYLAYLFKTDAWRNQIRSKVFGIKVYSVTKKILSDTTIICPPPCDQEKIADYLDTQCGELDSVLSRTRSSIEEYKKMRRAVISQTVTRGIRKNRKMKACGNGWVMELPDDWTEIPSKFLFRNSDTRRLDSDIQLTASQKHGIISQQEYMERENARVVLADKGLENWKHVEPYDFIISLRSFQGGLEMSEITGCITWHYIVLKPCKEVYSKYFKWLFKSELYIKAIQRTCNFIRDGQDLRYSNFVQVPLFEPPLEEQKEIADYLDRTCSEIDALIAKKEQYLVELENYKKSLIYEYVTGKKEVPDSGH